MPQDGRIDKVEVGWFSASETSRVATYSDLTGEKSCCVSYGHGGRVDWRTQSSLNQQLRNDSSCAAVPACSCFTGPAGSVATTTTISACLRRLGKWAAEHSSPSKNPVEQSCPA